MIGHGDLSLLIFMLLAILPFLLLFFGILAVLIDWAIRLSARWEKVFWLLAVVLAAINYRLWITTSGKDRMGLDMLAVLIFGLGCIILFLIPLCVRFLLRPGERRSDAAISSATPWKHFGVDVSDIVFAGLAGIVMPLMLFIWFGILARFPGEFAFALFAFAAAISAVYGRRMRRSEPTLGVTLSALGLGCVLMLAVAAASAFIVFDSAFRTARGNPYCIQSGERPARSIFDLSVLTMRERPQGYWFGVLYLRNHGLLVVDYPRGRQVFNWSYSTRTFKADSLADRPNLSARPRILCTPGPGGGIGLF